MSRLAILLANTAESDDPSLSVTPLILNRNIKNIQFALGRLGEYSFEVQSIADKKKQPALNDFHRLVQNYSKRTDRSKNSLLLFYYFGHAVVRENELCFVFKNSNTEQIPTMISFRNIAETIFGFHVPTAVFILDCCYAGAAEYQTPQFNSGKTRYFILASTTPTQKALIEKALTDHTGTPFGAFSNFLFAGLRDTDAAALPTKDITADSLFNYTKKLTEEKFAQTPYRIDGGLGDAIITQVSPKVIILPHFNHKAPKKSFYRKIWWLCNTIEQREFHNSKSFYEYVKRKTPVELLTPIKMKKSVVYRPVTQSTFEGYFNRLRSLGILKAGEGLDLSNEGKRLIAKNSKEFNLVLLDLIRQLFQNEDSSIEEIDSIIRRGFGNSKNG